MSHYEPDPDDQYAATTLDRSVFEEGGGGAPLKVAAPTQVPVTPPAPNVPAPQRRLAPPTESDFGLRAALALVVVLILALVIFLVVSLASASAA